MLIDSYLFREIVNKFCIIAGGLLIIMLSNVALLLLPELASGRISYFGFISMLYFQIPDILLIIAPISYFYALIVSYNYFNKNNELLALFVAGISFNRTTKSAYIITKTLFVLLLLNSFWLVPKSQELKAQTILQSAYNISKLRGGQFHEISKDKYLIRFKSSKENKLHDIVIINKDELNSWISAKSATIFTNSKGFEVHLEKGQSVTQNKENNITILNFSKYIKHFHIPFLQKMPKGSSLLTIRDLVHSNSVTDQVEVHWRMAPAFILFNLTFLALAMIKKEKGLISNKKMIFSLLIYVFYYVLLFLLKNLLLAEKIAVVVGLWPAHFSIFLYAYFLNKLNK